MFVSSALVDSQFPELPSKLESAGFTVHVKDDHEKFMIVAEMTGEYKTHWQTMTNCSGSHSKKIMFCLKSDDYLDRDDVEIVIIVPAPHTDDDMRVGRVLHSNRAKFIEIRSAKDLPDTLINVLTALNASKDKKVPNLYNSYKPNSKVEMSSPELKVFALMLAQIPGVSLDVAKGIASTYKTMTAFLEDLEHLGYRKISTLKGEKSLGSVLTLRIQKVFSSDSLEDHYID